MSKRGSRFVEAVKELKKELRDAYEEWVKAEQAQNEKMQQDLATLHSVLSGSEDKPLPAVPANPPTSQPPPGLQAIQTRAREVSRPGSPTSSEDSPVSGFKSDYLLKGPSRENSPPAGAESSDPPPPYTERARYDEVMRDIMEDAEDMPSPAYGDADGDDDNGHYRIQVVEPDASSTAAVSPQLSPEIPLPVTDEKQKPVEYVGLQSRGRSSRSSSISKGKAPKRSKSRSAQGTMRVVNPSESGAEEAQYGVDESLKYAAAITALEEAYKQLAFLRKGGVTARDLPRDVVKRIENLKVFLM